MEKIRKRSKKAVQERTNLEWALFIALLVIIYLFLASLNNWWPSNNKVKLGTAFYVTNSVPAGTSTTTGTAPADSSGATTDTGGGNSTGGGSNGGSGGNGSGGGSTTSPLLTFAAGVDTGNSKQDVSGRANGLNESCAVVANVSGLGKQEVCTYTEGDKIITVTYLNDRVISASRSGF